MQTKEVYSVRLGFLNIGNLRATRRCDKGFNAKLKIISD